MSALPVPASVYFDDFAFDVKEYDVLANGQKIGSYRGLKNSENGKPYIHFLLSENPQITVGNILRDVSGLSDYMVVAIGQDEYNGKPELIKAYF